MNKHTFTILVLCITCLQFSVTWAGVSQFITVQGIIWSFDEENIKVKDAQGTIWVVPRRLIKRKAELRPDQKIALKVKESEVRKYKAAN